MDARAARYWAKVDRRNQTECWDWNAARNPDGYGMFRGGNEQLAHRYGYRLAFGEIPTGLQVLHRCDRPPCQNPNHLFLGDPAINAADKIAKGRDRPPPSQPGEVNPQAKMTAAVVMEIRSRYAAGETQQILAAAFNTHQRNVSRIVRGERWAHLPLAVRPPSPNP